MEKILDEQYFDLIIDSSTLTPSEGNNDVTPINERYSLVNIPKTSSDPCILGQYPYSYFPTLFTLDSTLSLEATGVRGIQLNPYLALFGRGVLIGVIDTGIDYQHPAFLNNDGTTRIVSIWDQTIQEGTPPQGFTYGSEYERELINFAIQNDDPLSIVPSNDSNGHGTAIASIIAGNLDLERSFSGVVPESNLVVVKLKEAKQNLREVFFVPNDAVCFQSTDIMLGVRYLITVSQTLKRPISICIAMGSNQGGHDGEGALSSYLDYLVQRPWIGITAAGGNEGNSRRHYFGDVTAAPFYNDFELRVGNQDTMFSMEIWTDSPGSLAIEVVSPIGESTQLVYPRLSDCIRHDFLLSTSTLWINNIILEQTTGDQCILIRFQNAVEGIWVLRVQNLVGEAFSFHSWLPSGNLISNDTFFLQSSPDTTITTPGNSYHVLTITAYNQNNNSILIESSRGYTRYNQVKPDLAAPGFELPCATLLQGYGTLTGTGAAAAHATGIVAMLLEWAIVRGNFTQISGNDINHLLIRGAEREGTMTFPNNIWGFGRIDLNGFFEKLTL